MDNLFGIVGSTDLLKLGVSRSVNLFFASPLYLFAHNIQGVRHSSQNFLFNLQVSTFYVMFSLHRDACVTVYRIFESYQ